MIQRFSSQAKDSRGLPAEAGMNRFFWDMRYPGAREVPSDVALAGFEASRAGAAGGAARPLQRRG